MANIVNIPIPDQVNGKLIKLGIKEKDVDNETAILVSLYQQALKGNVSAIDKIQKLFDTPEKEEEKVKDKCILGGD